MTNTERNHKQEAAKLAKLETRQSELQAKAEQAGQELADAKEIFGRKLAEGNGTVDSLADSLAKKQAGVSVYEAAISELSHQLEAQRAVVNDVEAKMNAETKAEATRKLRMDTVKLIRKFADIQVAVATLQRHQQKHGLEMVNFKAVGTSLAEAQALCEGDPAIRDKSRIPRAERIVGFIDDQGRIATRGAKVLDWAWEESR